ncbi:MAG: FMN-binding protein, partial [Longicatena sp.]
KFEIIVNVETATVESLTPTEINDTPYKGDKIDNESFLGQFKGMNLKKDIKVEKNDAVSEATISSKSCVRAVEEVRKALG